MHLKRMICASAAVLGVSATAGPAIASAATIKEAGSTLALPLVTDWAAHYTGANVSPTGGGSGKGISLISHGQVDIGASDAPMSSSQFAEDTFGTPVQIPWALSATGIGYNIPGVGYGLKLTDAVLAQIYAGTIKQWSSPAITKPNPQFKRALQRAGTITPVFRSDGSGDSYAFSHFLAEAAPRYWHYGYGTQWSGPAGAGENGNSGVAGEVRANRGTIGYISAYYLINQHVTVARVQNAAGNYEYPNLPQIKQAGASNSHVSAQGAGFTGVSIVDPSRRYRIAYPISTYTYAIVNQNDANLSAVQGFLDWVISPSGGLYDGVALDFSPLPASIRAADAGLISSL